MKKLLKTIAVFAMAAMIILPASTADIYASSSVTIAGGDDIKGGDIFTVTVTFDGDSIGRVVGDITYDTEMISYISGGSSSGNVGYVELRSAGTGEPLVFELEFQAIKEGSTQLNVSASEMYDLGEGYMDTPSASKALKISGNADADEIVEETTVEDNAEEEGLSVDEKGDVGTDGTEAAESESGLLAKAIMFGIGALVLILIIVLLLRRKRK